MSYLQMVAFHRAKVGSSAAEWEDGVGFDPGNPSNNRLARCAAFDGATEAYDSIRWVSQLVDSFLGTDPEAGRPALTPAALETWFDAMQRRWLEESPRTFANIFEEHKFREDGSFATFLGCEFTGLGSASPTWAAASLGDVVLFHVRQGRLISHFPALGQRDFGVNPDGVFTQPSQRGRMRAKLRFASGTVELNDVMYLATDAVAAWIVDCLPDPMTWERLAGIRHPEAFDELADRLLQSDRMKNDDLTLLRIDVVESPPDHLAVCG